MSELSMMQRLRAYARANPPDPAKLEAERAHYHAQLRARLAGEDDPPNIPAVLARMGCPAAALRGLRVAVLKPALEAARAFIASEHLFLMLLGPVGCGKTTAATLVLEDFIRRDGVNNQPTGSERPRAMFVPARELTRVSVFGPEHADWLENMKRCRMLVLDDAGDEATENGKTAFVDLLIHRHMKERRTVVTGNLQPKAFAARYGAALADRIRDSRIAPNLWGEQSMRGDQSLRTREGRE